MQFWVPSDLKSPAFCMAVAKSSTNWSRLMCPVCVCGCVGEEKKRVLGIEMAFVSGHMHWLFQFLYTAVPPLSVILSPFLGYDSNMHTQKVYLHPYCLVVTRLDKIPYH